MARGVYTLLMLLGVVLGSLSARAEADALDALLARFAGVSGFSARFHEEKQVALLKLPLVSDGVLRYARPRTLVRVTESPRKVELRLDGDVLSFPGGRGIQQVSVHERPSLAALIGLFVSVLSGERVALERVAKVGLALRAPDGFRLELTPKDPALLKLVKRVVLEGRGNHLTRMDVEDARGDRTVTTFEAVPVSTAPPGEAIRGRPAP